MLVKLKIIKEDTEEELQKPGSDARIP
jgi:hypothetical protein